MGMVRTLADGRCNGTGDNLNTARMQGSQPKPRFESGNATGLATTAKAHNTSYRGVTCTSL
jgi:hypothetical protein